MTTTTPTSGTTRPPATSRQTTGTTPTTMPAATAAPTTTKGSARTLAKGTAVGIGLALVANAVVFLVGDLGAPIRVITGWAPDGTDLRIGDVVGATVALTIVGTLALWALERLRADGFRLWTGVAAAFAVLSILPVLRLDIDGGSKVALSVMHLVVGAAAIAGQSVARRARS